MSTTQALDELFAAVAGVNDRTPAALAGVLSGQPLAAEQRPDAVVVVASAAESCSAAVQQKLAELTGAATSSLQLPNAVHQVGAAVSAVWAANAPGDFRLSQSTAELLHVKCPGHRGALCSLIPQSPAPGCTPHNTRFLLPACPLLSTLLTTSAPCAPPALPRLAGRQQPCVCWAASILPEARS